MRLFLCVAAILAALIPAHAQQWQSGWGVGFALETFEGVVVPFGTIKEDTGDRLSLRPASIGLHCGADGRPVASFSGGGFSRYLNDEAVTFRFAGGPADVVFRVADIPLMGRLPSLDPASTERLIQGFAAANGNSVPFRSKDGQGVFPSVGVLQTAETVARYCR
jgi:hypothetical protein